MASPFSLHCMICVEEFTAERYPVVLPCGHTYICNQCGERLMKCMECRTPLTIYAPRPVAASPPIPSYRARRGSTSIRHRYEIPQTKNTAPPKRLPLPKNIVLISLMEATDVSLSKKDPPQIYHPVLPLSEHESEEKEEEAKIRLGTSLAISACGTYIVTEKSGAHIYPSKPAEIARSHDVSANLDVSESEDVDAMVRFFHLDHKLTLPAPVATATELLAVDLAKGDRIQIVSIEGGWAKLARGYGYVRCSKGEIVKVGGSIDRACKLEALLRSITKRRKELRMEQRKLDDQFAFFVKDLQNSLLNDEDFTVIGAKAESDDSNECDETSSTVASGNLKRPSNDPQIAEIKHATIVELSECIRGSGESATYADNENSELTTPHEFVQTEIPKESKGNSLASCFIHALSFSDDNDSVDDVQNSITPLLGSCSGGNDGTCRRDARMHDITRSNDGNRRSENRKNGRQRRTGRSESLEIDFKTGMSGHMALLSSQAHHLEGSPKPYMKSPGRISSHSGLTLPRRIESGLNTMPSYSTSSFDDDNVTI